MPTIEIKHLNGSILHIIEADSIKAAVEALSQEGANLWGADLGRANLRGANLRGAELTDTTYGEGVPLTKEPIYITGLKWDVMILDTHLKIGCELYSFEN